MNIDKVKELYVGQEFKNYKIFCNFMDEEPKKANSKISQIKEWNRYFLFKKEGQKIIITKIFDIPKDKIDNRIGGVMWNNRKYPNLGIYTLTNEQGRLKGVYKIQLDNEVYVGSTTVGFRTRYRQHSNNENNMTPHTQDLLKRGASFEILWIADENDSKTTIRQKENDYIEQYRNNGYDMLNSHVPVIKSEKRTINSKNKIKYKQIKINENDYEIAIVLLKENGLRIAI